MPKPQKIEAVRELKEKFEKSPSVLLAEFRGLKVQQAKELRRALAEGNAEFKVVKNTLTRIAVTEADLEGLLPMLEGSTAITFIKGDPVAAAKVLDEIAKKFPALSIKGGLVEGRVIDEEGARALAKVKPREQLLTELAGMMQGSVQKLVILLGAPIRSLGYALGAYQSQVEASGAGSETAPERATEEISGATTEDTPENPEATPDNPTEDAPENPEATPDNPTEDNPESNGSS